MAYYLQAFICLESDSQIFIEKFVKAKSIKLDQGLTLIPMTEELFDELNNFKISFPIKNFEYLNKSIEEIILKSIPDKKFAYIEAEYFGGVGGQTAIIWNRNQRQTVLEFGENNINYVLKDFGVLIEKGIDEFETLGFHFRRSTEQWLKKDK